jgi:hypothetical protein
MEEEGTPFEARDCESQGSRVKQFGMDADEVSDFVPQSRGIAQKQITP